MLDIVFAAWALDDSEVCKISIEHVIFNWSRDYFFLIPIVWLIVYS